MDIRYFITFKTILETGSFQNAANKLGYTQPTVTFQIKQLEEEYSIKLFEKIGRKMVLTQAGENILPYIDKILDLTQKIENSSEDNLTLSGTLKIAMPESLLLYKMQDVLKAFKKQAPEVKLSLSSLPCYTTNSSVINGKVDIGIQYDIESYTGNIKIEALDKSNLILIASKEITPLVRIDDIKKNTLILNNNTEDICRLVITEYLNKNKIYPDNIIELGSIEAIKRSVINNIGIAYVPKYTVESELKDGTLVEIKLPISNKPVTIICAYHQNKILTPAMELFIKLLKKQM